MNQHSAQSGHEQYGALIDPQRSTCLCDVGNPDYVAAVAVDPNGDERLWLAHRDLIGDDDADHGNPNQRHEKTGRLPQYIRDRIWGDSLRCGRPRLNGQPCRARVAEPGQPCGVHGGEP